MFPFKQEITLENVRVCVCVCVCVNIKKTYNSCGNAVISLF